MIPTRIILHGSATEDGRTYSWDAIRRYHMSYRYRGESIPEDQARVLIAGGAPMTPPWREIGYHAGIKLVGDRLAFVRGRGWDQTGAHCQAQGRNLDSLGLCVVGRFDIYPPTPELLAAAQKVAPKAQ